MDKNDTRVEYPKPITFNERGDRTRSVNGTLYFYKVTWEDQGDYLCVAGSRQGIIRHRIQVDVYSRFFSFFRCKVRGGEGNRIFGGGGGWRVDGWLRIFRFADDCRRFSVGGSSDMIYSTIHVTKSVHRFIICSSYCPCRTTPIHGDIAVSNGERGRDPVAALPGQRGTGAQYPLEPWGRLRLGKESVREFSWLGFWREERIFSSCFLVGRK